MGKKDISWKKKKINNWKESTSWEMNYERNIEGGVSISRALYQNIHFLKGQILPRKKSDVDSKKSLLLLLRLLLYLFYVFINIRNF